MWISVPAKIVWWTAQAALSPLSMAWFWINTGKTAFNIISDTWRSLLETIKSPLSKKNYKNFSTRIWNNLKTYKADTKEWWKDFWAPYEWKRDKSYGLTKWLMYPTHMLYGWAKYALWSALDFSWRAAATPFAWTWNMFLKKENKIKLWKWEKWFKANMKKWRGSYGEWFKQLKNKSGENPEGKPDGKIDEKKPDTTKWQWEKEMMAQIEAMKNEMAKQNSEANEKINKAIADSAKKDIEIDKLTKEAWKKQNKDDWKKEKPDDPKKDKTTNEDDTKKEKTASEDDTKKDKTDKENPEQGAKKKTK